MLRPTLQSALSVGAFRITRLSFESRQTGNGCAWLLAITGAFDVGVLNSRGCLNRPMQRLNTILMTLRKMLLIVVCWTAAQGVLAKERAVEIAETINVAVAANFVSTFKALKSTFEHTSGHTLRVSSGSSGRFYAQIKNGAPFDVFFSADQTTPARLEVEELAVAGSRFTYAVGALALWSANPDLVVDGAQVLRRGEFNKLALANPRLAPYGAAAIDVLTHLGLREATMSQWVQGENIAQTYQFVSTGNADLGFVALSQISAQGQSEQGSAWRIPAELHQPILQDAVLLRRGQTSQAAQALLHFMRSSEARAIIEANGYAWPTTTATLSSH
jgi:molybdate transport system substrate-binding protein